MSLLKNMMRCVRIFSLKTRALYLPSLPVCYSALIIAPHPDDETLGCGGLIQQLCSQGIAPHIIILTGGSQSHTGCCNITEEELKKFRRDLAQTVLYQFGLPEKNLHLLDFPDGFISENCQEMTTLRELITRLTPQQVFIPHHGEGWPDHLVVNKLLKNIPLNEEITIYQYCVWMWYYNVWKIEWKNACVLQLTHAEQNTKQKAVRKYLSEQAPCGKPWSGVLPPLLIRACVWNRELYFKIK